uniref:Uncharacterized protein n=1 Tax=Hyaloperonospora arabidopsidis (strain Emoy2) TaxID=559515 RepID=M4C3E2_HYAAE
MDEVGSSEWDAAKWEMTIWWAADGIDSPAWLSYREAASLQTRKQRAKHIACRGGKD